MVASTFMSVLDWKVVVTQSIYIVGASKEDQALLMDIRKKNMINNIIIIMTFIMLEPLICLPVECEKDFQLITSDFQLIRATPQLTVH